MCVCVCTGSVSCVQEGVVLDRKNENNTSGCSKAQSERLTARGWHTGLDLLPSSGQTKRLQMSKFEVWAEIRSSVTAILWDFTSRQKPFWSSLQVSYSSVNWDLFGIQRVAQGYFLFGQPLLAFLSLFQRVNGTFRVLELPLALI